MSFNDFILEGKEFQLSRLTIICSFFTFFPSKSHLFIDFKKIKQILKQVDCV